MASGSIEKAPGGRGFHNFHCRRSSNHTSDGGKGTATVSISERIRKKLPRIMTWIRKQEGVKVKEILLYAGLPTMGGYVEELRDQLRPMVEAGRIEIDQERVREIGKETTKNIYRWCTTEKRREEDDE